MAFQFLSTGHWVMWNILFKKEAGSFLFSCLPLVEVGFYPLPQLQSPNLHSFSSWRTLSLMPYLRWLCLFLVPLPWFSPTPPVQLVALCPVPTFPPIAPRVPASSFILSSFLASYSYACFLSLPPVGHSLSCHGTFLLIFLDHSACRYKPALISCLPSFSDLHISFLSLAIFPPQPR